MKIFFRATVIRLNFVGLDSTLPVQPRGLSSHDYGFGLKLVCASLILRELAGVDSRGCPQVLLVLHQGWSIETSFPIEMINPRNFEKSSLSFLPARGGKINRQNV